MAPENRSEAISSSFSQLVHRLAIWPTLFTAIILLLAFYHPSILSESNDGQLFVPISAFAHPDKLPLWDALSNGGMPIWGDAAKVAQINVLDSALFSLLLPIRDFVPDIKFLYLLLNMLLFSGSMYAFARRNKMSPLAASFVALIILFMPQYVVGVLNGSWMDILALTLLPVILLFMQNLFEKRTLLWFSLSAIFYGWQLLRASAIISVVTTIFIVAAYFIFIFSKPGGKSSAISFRSGLLMLAGLAAGFLAAAYVYAPFIEYLRYAQVDMNWQNKSLIDLVLFFIPSFHGAVVQSPHIAFYVGAPVLFLSGIALVLKRDTATLVWAALALLFVAASLLGRSFEAAFALPFLLIVIAGFGLDSLFVYRKNAGPRQRKQLDIYMIMVFSIFAAVFALLLVNKAAYMQHILKQIPLLTIPLQQKYYHAALLESALVFLFVLVMFLMIRLFVKQKLSAGIFAIVVLLLSLIDLLLIDYKFDFPAEEENLIPVEIIELLHQDDSQFRIFSTLDQPITDLPSITDKNTMPLNLMRDFYLESGYNEADVSGMRNPFFSKYARLVSRSGEIIEEPIPVQYIDPARLFFDRSMLDMLNVKYILCNSPIYDPQYHSVSDSGIFVYENKTMLPRAFFVDSVAVLPGRRAIFDDMKAHNFYPTSVLYVDKMPPFQTFRNDSNKVSIEYVGSRKILLRAHVQLPAALLLSEVYYFPGWKAFVDNESMPLFRANHFLRALFLDKGEHDLVLRFQPASFLIGWWTSLCVISLLMIAGIVGAVLALRSLKKQQASI